ncbi:MAG: hypothetical protein RIR53_481 [Bacteroidota bacterium]
MPTRYVMLTLSIHEEDSDVAVGILSGYPLVGIEQGLDSMTACFDQNDWQPDYETSIAEELSVVGVKVHGSHVQILDDRNWNAEWESSIEPVVVNERIVIVPEWHTQELPQSLRLTITPKMSFGTGHHSTTRMMCRLLEKHVTPDSSWIDVGTGTGVLAILAARLGAASVFAFDNDEWSFSNALENIDRNAVSGVVHLEHTDLQSVSMPRSTGLAANLYRHLVIPYAGAFVAAVEPGGMIILSGILRYDADDVCAPFLALGCRIDEILSETEWCAIALQTPKEAA